MLAQFRVKGSCEVREIVRGLAGTAKEGGRREGGREGGREEGGREVGREGEKK